MLGAADPFMLLLCLAVFTAALVGILGLAWRLRAGLAASSAREAALSAFLDSSPAAMIEVDREGRIMRASQAARRLGVEAGRRLDEIVAPDETAGVAEALAGRATALRITLRGGTADARSYDIRATALPRAGGMRVALWLDPAPAPPAPRRIDETETILRGIIESSADCIQVLDLDGIVQFASRNGLYLMGVDAEAEILGRPFVGLWPRSTHDEIRAALAAAGAGAAAHFSAPCLAKAAIAKHLDVLVTPIRDAVGRPERLVVLSRDRTHLRRTEADLRASEARYRLLAENASDVIILQSASHERRSYVSPAVTTLLGYRPEAFAALPLEGLVHPDDLATLRSATEALDAHGRTTNVHRLRHERGGWVWVEGTYRRIAGTDPGAPDVIAVLRDVTDRQNQADELRTAKAMAELAQARAELANAAKTDFLAAVSHEIRTPLNSIIGFSDLLALSDGLGRGERRQVDLIRSAGDALLTLINDILDFSKIEAGAIGIEKRPFDLVGLLVTTRNLIAGSAEAKRLALATDIDPAIAPMLLGDEARLRQILLNLLNNAVKFTSAGTVTLTAALLRDVAGAQTLRIAVVDTGPGIPRELQARLFQRFSQLDGSASRGVGGTGLGLAISRQLVELMGGSIGVDSDVGDGATFWLELTLETVAVMPAQTSASPAHHEPDGGGRLLLVEDLRVNQELARAVLEARGHEVDVVEDGRQAIAALQARPYDLVLMDIQMPGMDGITATRAIRALGPPARDVPIVAMSASVFPEQIEQFRRAGMNDHVGKPFKREVLYGVVDRWLGRGPSGRDPDAAASDGGEAERIDMQAYAGLTRLLGKAKAGAMLDQFASQMASRFDGDAADPDTRARLRRDAHAMVGAAGIIGFRALADCCRSLETAAEDGPDFAAELGRLRRESRWSVRKIRELNAELGGTVKLNVEAGTQHA